MNYKFFKIFKILFFGFLGLFLVLPFGVLGVNYTYDQLNRLIEVKYNNNMVVRYTYDAVGNRLTKQITPPEPKALKQETAKGLEEVKTGKRIVDRYINNAIKHVNKSLDDSLWQDDFHLEPDLGARVFFEERTAAREMVIVKGLGVGGLDSLIKKLVEADKILAGLALKEAKEICLEGSCLQYIDIAEQWLEAAELSSRPYYKIKYYQKAWQNSQKAVRYNQ